MTLTILTTKKYHLGDQYSLKINDEVTLIGEIVNVPEGKGIFNQHPDYEVRFTSILEWSEV